MEQLTATPLSNIDVSELADGVYAGSHHVFPITAEVNVTIQNRRISSIELVKHIHSRGSQAEAIIDKVIEAQSLDVDAISGATYSSMVILRAIEDALRNATWPD
ncbi:MAG TPA: FMN-binding protein [Firmicutes bacterium]|nr:FMN-binding protein [Bacillota bacterium]